MQGTFNENLRFLRFLYNHLRLKFEEPDEYPAFLIRCEVAGVQPDSPKLEELFELPLVPGLVQKAKSKTSVSSGLRSSPKILRPLIKHEERTSAISSVGFNLNSFSDISQKKISEPTSVYDKNSDVAS